MKSQALLAEDHATPLSYVPFPALVRKVQADPRLLHLKEVPGFL